MEFGALPAFNNSPAFGSGGFPSFEEWMRMKNIGSSNEASRGISAISPTLSSLSGPKSPEEEGWKRSDAGWVKGEVVNLNNPSNYSSPASSSGGNRPPDLGQSISALEQIIGQTSKGGKMTSKDFALINALENSKQEAQRKAWSDAVVASGGTVVTRPIAGPWGSGGKMVGYD